MHQNGVLLSKQKLFKGVKDGGKILARILYKYGVFKRTALTLALLAFALLKARIPSIRGLADYLPLPYTKQAKTNKIWRFSTNLNLLTHPFL